MQFSRPALFALAVYILTQGTASWLGAKPFSSLACASDYGESPNSSEAVPPESSEAWIAQPQPVVPGPGWFADNAIATGENIPPADDGWRVAFPFKYFPPGQFAGEVGRYAACLFPPEAADGCFCTPPPCYFGTFFFEVLVLDRRSNLEQTDLFFDSTSAAMLNTADFNLETEAGVRVGFLLASPCGNDWTGEYFGIHTFQDSITRTDAAGITDVFFGQTGAALASLTAEYESNLDSLDFTIRSRQARRLALLAGVRYVQVDEVFNSIHDPATRVGWFSHSDNDLFGFQFGCQGLIFEAGRWRLETTAKAGPYFNDIDVHVRVNPPGQDFVSKHVSHGHTAFVGDLRLGVVCQLGPRLNFRIGYQGLWIEGMALAPNQNNNISFATNLESVDLGGVIYQGGYIGFDLSW